MLEPIYIYAALGFVLGFAVAFFTLRGRRPSVTEPASGAASRTEAVPVAEAPAPAEATHASGLFLLAMLQREGRFVDFLQEEVAGYSDEQVGAAARVVHQGCRKVLQQYLSLEPVLAEAEGASVDVPAGFDASRIRLVGNVAGAPPFRGSLKHHGWAAKEVKFPMPSRAVDIKVLAPAEVELS